MASSNSGNISTSANPTTSTSRRSARIVQELDPIIAPGYGTRKDVHNLAQQLDLSPELVLRIMRARGRGSRGENADTPTANAPTVNAWADFMAEEGVGTSTSATASTSAAASTPAATSSTSASTSSKRTYDLTSLSNSKQKKKKVETYYLAQAGTLDSTLVGRSKVGGDQIYHLPTPTILSNNDNIYTHVYSSCSGVHTIALDARGRTYAWGRNEHSQLSADLSSPTVLPTLVPALKDHHIVMAATGKLHSLFLDDEGHVWAVGNNKAGQCGIASSQVETIVQPKQCQFDHGDVTIVQVRRINMIYSYCLLWNPSFV